jgi:hypothetical protein
MHTPAICNDKGTVESVLND